MKYITLIPARGGSKRFPGKNIHMLNGMPLIEYSIQYSFQCNLINATYVSTDDKDIKAVASISGATVLDRSEELATDHASTAAVMQDAVRTLIDNGVEFDYVVLLQATNPLRPKDLLKDAIKIIEEKHCSSLMAVNRCDKKLGKIIDNQFKPWNYYFGQRSQDMEPLYYENGLLYITSKEMLLEGKVMDESSYPLVVDHIYGEIDIDTYEDMKYAEYIINNY